MKKGYFCFCLMTLLLGFVPSHAAAPQTALDLQDSKVSITFTPPTALDPGDLPPAFTCFGKTASNTGGTIEASFEEIGISDPADLTAESVQNCFHFAGTYQMTVTLEDEAGNQTVYTTAPNSSNPIEFSITPSDPSDTVEPSMPSGTLASTFQAGNCNSGSGNRADNSAACNVTATFRDRFGNLITSIPQSTLESPTQEFLDGGGSNFRSSINIGGSCSNILGGIPGHGANTISLTDGIAQLSLAAFQPSLQQNPVTRRVQSVDRALDFVFTLASLDGDGGIQAGSSTDISFPSQNVFFGNLFNVDVQTAETFILEEANNVDFELIVNGGMGPVSDVDAVFVGGSDHRFFEYVEGDPNATPPEPDQEVLITESVPLALGNRSSAGILTSTEILVRPPDQQGQASQDDELYFDPRVTYNLCGPITHSAAPDCPGGVCDEVGIRFIGADIEGGILNQADDTLFQHDDQESSLTRVGNITSQDIRAQIAENAARLIRGTSNERPQAGDTVNGDIVTFDTNWFSGSDVAVVVGKDVRIGTASVLPGTTTLPEGRKTLVIQDGNLIINHNLEYSNNAQDSFGFILVNSTPDEEPETGNIFANSNVKELVGSFYGDGGIMTNDNGNENGAGKASITNSNNSNISTENQKQLLLTGTLFSRNTLGGSLRGQGGQFFTPWGETTDPDLSRRYDLHFVRRYRGDGNTTNCVAGNVAGCDRNINAFVIRNDRKVGEFTPPGFGTSDSISR